VHGRGAGYCPPEPGKLAAMIASSAQSERGLTIGIDARAATEVKAGRGRVVRELMLELAARDDPHRYRCYAREPWDAPLDDRFSWSLIRSPDPLWHVRTAMSVNRECDVFLSSNSYLTVLMVRIPAVVAVMDLLAFDRETQPDRSVAMIERLTLRPGMRRARAIWCISEATARALIERVPAAGSKVTVIPLAAATELGGDGQAQLENTPAPGFVLAVGTLEPRKNLPRLVEAYASLPQELQEQHPLVVVGAKGWRTGPTLAALHSLGDRCLMLGHVTDLELAELYRRCAVFSYPSLGEGFGLPVLEAMAAGAAVLTSDVTSLPEVGGAAVEYVDPRSVSAIAEGLTRLLESPARRAELRALAQARAQEFSWRETAARVLDLLESVARDGPGRQESAVSRVR
jgi:glycosyltransferase involved in cell wall biosynthesis